MRAVFAGHLIDRPPNTAEYVAPGIWTRIGAPRVMPTPTSRKCGARTCVR